MRIQVLTGLLFFSIVAFGTSAMAQDPQASRQLIKVTILDGYTGKPIPRFELLIANPFFAQAALKADRHGIVHLDFPSSVNGFGLQGGDFTIRCQDGYTSEYSMAAVHEREVIGEITVARNARSKSVMEKWCSILTESPRGKACFTDGSAGR